MGRRRRLRSFSAAATRPRSRRPVKLSDSSSDCRASATEILFLLLGEFFVCRINKNTSDEFCGGKIVRRIFNKNAPKAGAAEVDYRFRMASRFGPVATAPMW